MTQTLLYAGLVNAILAALLAMIVAPLASLLRGRPALVHGLWLLVLLKLVTPPLVHLPLPWPEAARKTEMEGPLDTSVGPALADVVSELRARPIPMPENQSGEQREGSTSEEQDFPSASPSISLPVEDSGNETESVNPFRGQWLSAILAAGLAGTCACWSLTVIRLWRLNRLLRTVPASEGKVAERIGDLSARLGLARRPLAHLVPGIMPPMVLVLGRTSRLLLPASLWERLDATQRDTLLLHELSHLRRGDHRVRWLELVVLGLYWWHPIAWWACRALRDAEEECCDAWVLWAAPEAGLAYAGTLVETVAYLSGAPAALPAGASGAGPIRLIKRRLSMILRGKTSRCLSRPTLAAMLLMGLALLPLVPTFAQTRPEKVSTAESAAEPDPKAVVELRPWLNTAHGHSKELHWGERYCQSCHTATFTDKKVRVDKLHDEVVRLIDDVAKRRQELAQAETRLKAALERFELQQQQKTTPRPATPLRKQPADRRLDDVEKKLEQLLEEIEKLRKDLRPGRGGSTTTGRSDVQYVNKRQFAIPVRWNPATPESTRKARLYVTTNDGKNYAIVGSYGFHRESGQITSISYNAARDGEFGFLLLTPDQEGRITPEMLEAKEPMLRVVVDTVPPKVVVQSVYDEESGTVKVKWEATDANLDLNSLRLVYRAGDKKELTEIRMPPRAKGTRDLSPVASPWEICMIVSDKAGNVGEATLKHPRQP
jgi:beta-lactamase regulating signal transducer with metallopeptidase domain